MAKLNPKTAKRISVLFNSIAVAQIFIRDACEEMKVGPNAKANTSYLLWTANRNRAAQALWDEFGILDVGCANEVRRQEHAEV